MGDAHGLELVNYDRCYDVEKEISEIGRTAECGFAKGERDTHRNREEWEVLIRPEDQTRVSTRR